MFNKQLRDQTDAERSETMGKLTASLSPHLPLGSMFILIVADEMTPDWWKANNYPDYPGFVLWESNADNKSVGAVLKDLVRETK